MIESRSGSGQGSASKTNSHSSACVPSTQTCIDLSARVRRNRVGMEPLVADATGFHCEVTCFHGFEDEILRLRNANRERAETLEYLFWRYQFTADAPEPRIFWLLSPDRERVGMAAVIFRPYRVNKIRV